MYVREIEIRNFRSLRNVQWKLGGDTPPEGWHVVLGGPGAGKSTFLQAIDFTLTDVPRSFRCHEWLSFGKDQGSVGVTVCSPNTSGQPQKGMKQLTLLRNLPPGYGKTATFPKGLIVRFGAPRYWEKSWWDWAKGLQSEAFAIPQGNAEQALSGLITLVNRSGLLPEGIKMVGSSSEEPGFSTSEGELVPPKHLGDGCLVGISLIVGMVAYTICYLNPNPGWRNCTASDIFREGKVVTPGVFLIDEPELHLHPSRQRELGPWLTEHFPNIQFIVATNSPFICQAAEKGSIFLLENGTGRTVVGPERDRLVYGHVLEAYDTESFGVLPTRSDAGMRMMERLGQLNVKELREELSKEEKVEQLRLKGALPTAQHFMGSWKAEH